jgi:ferrous iron transport protein B
MQDTAAEQKIRSGPQRPRKHLENDILLVGQPNVGKSVLFSHLTGVRTIASNYPGTTVSYALGRMRGRGSTLIVVDAPGTYSLEPLDEAARVTVDLIDDATRIINVVDSTHLERHLPMTLELIAQNKPMVVALNMSDEARHRGISIDVEKLSTELGVPVVPIVAPSGEGVKQLIDTCLDMQPNPPSIHNDSGHPGHHPHIEHPSPAAPRPSVTAEHIHLDRDRVWQRVGELVEKVQTLEHHHHSFTERLEGISIHPFWGSLLALAVITVSFSLIRLIGEFLISGAIGIVGRPWVELPFGTELLFEKVLNPPLMALSRAIGPESFLQKLLIGTLVNGRVDFMQSFGILSSGIFIPIGVVLPYLLSFYFVLSLLEDSGYLPRLAVFLDNFMHRIGLHGYAIIPTLLGLGCNVPGIMATRILESRRQRFITATLISIAVPCAALQAMIVGLVGSRGIGPVLIVYGTLFAIWLLISLVLRFTVRGFQPELLVEIPPYRLPRLRALGSKMWLRISGFVREALPIILGAIVAVNVLYQLKLFSYLAGFAEPLITRLWGMPSEAVVPLLVGILRKDVALGLLAPLDLTGKQLIIGSVLLAMFFPCIATFVVLFRELGFKDGLKSIGIMLLAVFLTGTALNLILP